MGKSIYLAGKIRHENDWRSDLLDKNLESFTGDLSTFSFAGPWFFDVQHGYSSRFSHGHSLMDVSIVGHGQLTNHADVIDECLTRIGLADIVFAWLTDKTCYGTLFELGYATARKKIIIVVASEEFMSEAWFPAMAATLTNGEIIRIEDANKTTPRQELIKGLKLVGEYLPSLKYQDYLKTDHWKSISEKAKRMAKNRCQLCNSNGELHAHHRTYERRGFEEMSDLIVLCAICHARHHSVTNP